MWNLFIVGSLQFPNDSTIASLEANQNRPKIDQNLDDLCTLNLSSTSTGIKQTLFENSFQLKLVRNSSIELQCHSIDWFLYESSLIDISEQTLIQTNCSGNCLIIEKLK